jgi:thiosulfate/3-mercaptopyruvate sulfurtransferase
VRHAASLTRAATLLFCAATLVVAQRLPNRDSLVVSSAWLASHLGDANLVVLQVGDRADYDKQHIPGARPVSLDDIAVSDRTGNGLTLEMPPADQLRESLAKLGISDDSRIVVYYDRDRVTAATRVMFTLDYAGLGVRSALLDGGMGAWTRDGRPTTSSESPTRSGRLSPLEVRPIVTTADAVRAHIGKPSVSIVDARATTFYDGTQTGSGRAGPHRTGHIAGAKNVPYTGILNEALNLKSTEQLAALFSTAGVAPGDTVIGYCHIGQQATAMLFAARLTGHPVILYDGSFEDWSRHADFPVDNPAAKGRP